MSTCSSHDPNDKLSYVHVLIYSEEPMNLLC